MPVSGYDKTAALAKRANAEGNPGRQLALEERVLPAEELNRLLDPASMTKAGE